jgi:hypothetical protein
VCLGVELLVMEAEVQDRGKSFFIAAARLTRACESSSVSFFAVAEISD